MSFSFFHVIVIILMRKIPLLNITSFRRNDWIRCMFPIHFLVDKSVNHVLWKDDARSI